MKERIKILDLKDNKIYSGVDDHKDQSYFLSQVRKEDISKMLFPKNV